MSDDKEDLEKLLKDQTELGAVMSNLDSDTVDEATRMSKIDFNARLTDEEINATLILDELIRMGILPSKISLSRQKKRLSVSKDGLGREEKVRIVQGDRESKTGQGIGQRLKNLFIPQG